MKRRLLLAAFALTSSLLVLGCGGSGKIYQPLQPTALYTFGDGMVDDGQTGALYTVNSTNQATSPVYSLPSYIASGYGLPLQPQVSGGNAWAKGGSSIADMQTQINSKLAAGNFGNQDLIVISAGMEDLIRETQNVTAGSENLATATSNIQAQVQSLGNQMQQLYNGGARYIYVLPPFDLSNSPWMATLMQTQASAPSVYSSLYATFQSAIAAQAEAVNNNTQSIFLSPSFRTYMGIYSNPSNTANTTGITNVTQALCSPPGNLNANVCNTGTLVTSDPAQQATYLYADNRHPVPNILALLGQNALNELHNRWG